MVSDNKTLTKLNRRIDEERPDLDRFEQYTRGKVPLEFIAPEVREALGDRLRTLQLPWARHVIAAIEERLSVVGFRTSKDSPADAALWSIWQANNLDEGSQLAHAEALMLGRSFALVWAGTSGNPVVTVESARQCAVLHDPATRARVAGLKRWVADEYGHAVLFEPTKVTRFKTLSKVIDAGTDTPGSLEGAQWEQVETMPNPLGVVPLIPLVNRPSISDAYGRSELADLLPLFDALTKLQTDLMVSSEYHANPRRYASGLVLEEEQDDEGQPSGEIDRGTRFNDLPGRLWVAEDAQARFGQFPGSDLSGFLNALGMLKRDLSAVSSLPFHYIGLFGDTPSSADAIRSAEASLVALVRRKAMTLAGGWEEAMRLAHAIQVGYFAPDLASLETIWADFETRTVAQAMDAASKGVASGILDPDFAAEKFLGLTPTEARRNQEARRARALEAAAAQMVTDTTKPKAIEQ